MILYEKTGGDLVYQHIIEPVKLMVYFYTNNIYQELLNK